MFMRPGISHLPAASIFSARGGTATVPAGPTAVIRLFSTTITALRMAVPAVTSTTLPPVMAVTLARGVCWA
jgi:hypothetical protein